MEDYNGGGKATILNFMTAISFVLHLVGLNCIVLNKNSVEWHCITVDAKYSLSH